MDKEAQGKILIGLFEYQALEEDDSGQAIIENLAYFQVMAKRIINNGFRKLPKDKPPLLSDEEFADAQVDYIKKNQEATGLIWHFPLQGWLRDDCNRKAQREADIKWYEGGK